MINFLLKEKKTRKRKKYTEDEIYRTIYNTDKEIKKIKKENKKEKYIIEKNINIDNLQNNEFNIDDLALSYLCSNIYDEDDNNGYNYNKINIYDNDEMNVYNNNTQMQIDYDDNYSVKELKRIMEYYGLSKRRKNKATIIEELIMFETDIINHKIVNRRRRLWHYIEEIKIDNYLSKFVNF